MWFRIKKFICWVLGIHNCDNFIIDNENNVHHVCKYCNRECFQDKNDMWVPYSTTAGDIIRGLLWFVLFIVVVVLAVIGV